MQEVTFLRSGLEKTTLDREQTKHASATSLPPVRQPHGLRMRGVSEQMRAKGDQCERFCAQGRQLEVEKIGKCAVQGAMCDRCVCPVADVDNRPDQPEWLSKANLPRTARQTRAEYTRRGGLTRRTVNEDQHEHGCAQK